MISIKPVIWILFLVNFTLHANHVLAVADFEAKSLSSEEATVLSDRLRNELVTICDQTHACTVIDRNRMDQILKEQKFQQSGCVSNACMVKIGEIIGAEYIIGGSIGRVGSIYSVNAQEISVSTAEITMVGSYDSTYGIEDLLSNGMADIARQLTGISKFELPIGNVGSKKNQVDHIDRNNTFGSSHQSMGLVIDDDGNVYSTVLIGDDVWFKENLKVRHYQNSSPITFANDFSSWNQPATGVYTTYNFTDELGSGDGLIYNWYASIDEQGICPDGWHVPSLQDWKKLYRTFGGFDIAGSKMKAFGMDEWFSDTEDVTNPSGFTAQPEGYLDGGFHGRNTSAVFWSSTGYNSGKATAFKISGDSPQLEKVMLDKSAGASIRCVQD